MILRSQGVSKAHIPVLQCCTRLMNCINKVMWVCVCGVCVCVCLCVCVWCVCVCVCVCGVWCVCESE